MSTEESSAEKLTRLRQEKSTRDAVATEARDLAEIECLELESKLSDGGKRLGVDFAIVFDADLGSDGLIAVKLGSDLAFRKFVDAATVADGLPDAATMYEFTAPALLHPAPEQYAAIARARGGLAARTCEALTSLHRIREKKVSGKF